MKEYLAKKYIFSALFIVVIFALSISNFIFSFDMVKKDMVDKAKTLKERSVGEIMYNLNTMVDTFENSAVEHIEHKYKYIELFGTYNRVLGKNEFNSFDVIKDNRGNLYSGNIWAFDLVNDIPTPKLAKRVYNMSEKLKGTKTKVYVVSMPLRTMPEYMDYEKGLPIADYSDVADDYLYYCSLLNLRTIDMRTAMNEAINNNDLTYEDLFFRTDHHWTPLAGFYGFKYLVEQLRIDGYDLDKENYYTNIENYEMETYDDFWVGTFGAKTGIVYMGDYESFTLIKPAFKTKYRYSYYDGMNEKIGFEGDFESTILDKRFLKMNTEMLYKHSAYSSYMNGIRYNDKIVNLNNPDGPRVLFIRDSYTSTMAAFFASVCSSVDMIWSLEYTGNIEELVENGNYDFVFIATWPQNLGEESFNFYKD